MSHRSLPAPWQRPAPSPAEWDVADVARGAAGRTVVVTGASTGIGFAAAELLAPHAAHVLTVSPDEAQGAAAAAVLRSRVPGARVSHVTCDLADLAQVRRAAVRITESANGRIDLLLNNAGVAAVPPGLTRDGFETHLGVNHLGHFALTGLLMPALLRSPRPRVVNVSSVLHRLGRPHPHTPHRPPRYHRWRAYADSKLANLLFTTGLNLWAREHGMPLSAVSAHPGLVRTALGSDALHAAGRPREAAALRWLQARAGTPRRRRRCRCCGPPSTGSWRTARASGPAAGSRSAGPPYGYAPHAGRTTPRPPGACGTCRRR
ncbi:SDR family NAD(P)-dependent oxidoreductase [Streptomyces sp. HNM0574]|uniref:SDR family NAD(P)-dependent oxidoreductase n=1 Tax=Streptomyces sp. HNM0574 TaxID=2714954 RepID=UPI00146F4856|nr:SDR family NAD(P)-dependent oxidoreductase [Streptomyces sp. HNM0574]